MSDRDNVNDGPLLTAREREILVLVARGFSTREVAQEVKIASRTVDRHIENARLKLGARNRTHLVVRAMMEGVL